MTTPITAADLAEAEEDRARARRFFWAYLLVSAALTLAGNSAAAMLDVVPPLAVRLAVHLTPPVVALVAVHAVAVLARAGAAHRARRGTGAADRAYTTTVGTATVIAGLAAMLSYAGLVAVARAGGLTPVLAAVWPLVIDLGIGLSSAALLVVLRPMSAADLRAARAAARATPALSAAARKPASTQLVNGSALASAPRPAAEAAPAPEATAPRLASVSAPTSAPESALDLDGAVARVMAARAVKQPESVIRGILAAKARGAAKQRIADDLAVHHTVVQRVLDAAASAPAATLTAI